MRSPSIKRKLMLKIDRLFAVSSYLNINRILSNIFRIEKYFQSNFTLSSPTCDAIITPYLDQYLKIHTFCYQSDVSHTLSYG